ncbi:MAG: FlgD immunoglobulin-like domain containing protein [bacterium]
MKRLHYFSSNCILSGVCLLATMLAQQAWSQDYLDVPAGFETLNLAVAGDSLPNGTRNPNRVYRLENGGFYLINGTIDNSLNGGFEMHVQAADPSGPMPVLIPFATGTGEAPLSFSFVANGSLKGLYLSSLDQNANYIRNNVRLDQDGISVTVDSCFLDYDRQAPLRANAFEQKFYIYNTIVRNCSRAGTQNTGRCIDIRENLVDSLVVQNCTFYFATGEIINDQGGALIRNLIFDHNTMVGTDKLDSHTIFNGRITNNLFINVGWEMDDIAGGDTLREEILPIDSLRSPLFTEADRRILINRNNFNYSQEFHNYVNSVDTVDFYVLHNTVSQRFIAENPNIVSENWIDEYPDFAVPPDYNLLMDWAVYQISGAVEAGTPDVIADPRPNDENDIINTFGLADVLYGKGGGEFEFDYPTSKASYTHAEGGFPLGDLNWFPAKKAEWQSFVSSVSDKGHPNGIPTAFALAQNYPNPFNPATTIEYEISKSTNVSLAVYDIVGRRVRTLVSTRQNAGHHRVTWDGTNDGGRIVANGVYVYRLQVDGTTLSRKLLLVK